MSVNEKNNIPRHVAIIPDGNRRWAKQNNLPSLEGHHRGAANFEKLLDKAKDIGIKSMTGWFFSTENWKRSEGESKYLWDLARQLTKQYKKKFLDNDIRFIHLGRKDRIPEDVAEQLEDLEKRTKDRESFMVGIAMDYGGHDEILRTFTKLKEQGLEFTKENVEKNLDTAFMPMPELIIRTGGDKRLSGFMLWQSEYAEFYFADEYFPDFTPEKLEKAIKNYMQRERRFGGDSKK